MVWVMAVPQGYEFKLRKTLANSISRQCSYKRRYSSLKQEPSNDFLVYVSREIVSDD